MKKSREEQLLYLQKMNDDDIDCSDIPMVEDFSDWQPNPFYKAKKFPLSARIDADVMVWLKKHENVSKFLNSICREKMLNEQHGA